MRAAVFLLALLAAIPAIGQQAGAGSTALEPVRESITITASPLGPDVDLRNGAAFRKTLFTRDDQIFHFLDAGINAGQHEGGGKSLKIRRFGFNLDHGGVNGGLRVTVDNAPQNHSTQGHGQGYLGSLKSLTPELIEDVTLINGPFSAEHGDYSGLGVVQIRLKESLPHRLTARIQRGAYGTWRGFAAWSPNVARRDAVFAYDSSHSDGPFLKPLDYNRHNVSGAYTWLLGDGRRFGLKWNGGTNTFNSSGQIPLDEVAAGRLDRFGAVSSSDGGDVRQGRFGVYYSRNFADGSRLKADAFAERSLFDLYSNFTFFLSGQTNGDGIQQHDSRLTEGGNAQYQRPQIYEWGDGLLTLGGGVYSSQNAVDLRRAVNRNPFALLTAAEAGVTNGSGYLQQNLNLAEGRVQLGGGLRWDVFRYAIADILEREFSGIETAAKLQPKANVAFSPWRSAPLKVFFNYGRGIASLDARGVIRRPESPHVNTTDFYQWGIQHHFGNRASLMTDVFLIDTSNQLVYIPDDGSLEFADPARSYGFETRGSVAITQRLSLDGGVTKVLNAYYRDVLGGMGPRVYVDSAPRFTANAALTLADWRGWSGSMRMRAINHYRLDGLDPTIAAAGHTVFDLAFNRRLTHQLELSIAVDNLLDRDYWEVQNYFESRVPGQAPRERVHGTPGYGRNVMVGLTLRLGGK